MAVKMFCDLCGVEISWERHTTPVTRFEMRDGEHPHCGSTMHKSVEACSTCYETLSDKLDLKTTMEYDDAVKLCKR